MNTNNNTVSFFGRMDEQRFKNTLAAYYDTPPASRTPGKPAC